MKNKNLSWAAALFVFALLLWCTAATPGKIADPSTYTCAVYSTFFSLLPPVIAIVLALNTKEVYTSLLVGIASGALLYANGNLELALNTLFFHEEGGMIAKLSDSSNVGILVFLVMLGILVALMNKAGGSAAFGRWASKHIHSRAGAQFATLLLGVMIFVDDYFNCLTVGSVMRPVTDRQKVSRAKLAYLIDSTAAPICIIAPVSSWAAAVTSSVPEGSGINGFTMFLRTIPYNYYAILTMVFIIIMTSLNVDYGPMKKAEERARTTGKVVADGSTPMLSNELDNIKPKEGFKSNLILHFLIPAVIVVVINIGTYVIMGTAKTLEGFVLAVVYQAIVLLIQKAFDIREMIQVATEGIKSVVSAMLILSLAYCINAISKTLGTSSYVISVTESWMTPVTLLALTFAVCAFMAFFTGTSWGVYAIMIPIAMPLAFNMAGGEATNLVYATIAAVMGGGCFGDHCSPISDTTIMASAGAHCSHVNHVSTQLPYAITAASCAAVCYVITGIAQAFLGANGSLFTSLILLAVAIAVELVVLSVIRVRTNKKAAE